MRYEPTQDRVIVRKCDPPAMSDGGLVIPETAKMPSREAIVVAIGPGRLTDSGQRVRDVPQLEPGQRVLIFKGRGHEIDQDGEKLIVIQESDVICLVR